MAKNHREFEIWQLGSELRDKTIALLDRLAVGQDRDLFNQLRDAAASPARNIAEGFARYQSRDFARFLEIAKGSLAEIDTHLRDLAQRRKEVEVECGELVLLAARCNSGVIAQIAYLLGPRNTRLPPSPRTRTVPTSRGRRSDESGRA